MTDLSHLVPAKRFWTNYKPRKIPKSGMTDIELIEAAVKKQLNIMMTGPTGPGKTSAMFAVAAKNEWPLGTFNCNGMTAIEDFYGQLVPIGGGGKRIRQCMAAVSEWRTKALIAKKQSNADDYLAALIEQQKYELELQYLYEQNRSGLEYRDGLLFQLMVGDPNFEHSLCFFDEVNFAQPKIMAGVNGVTDDRREITNTQTNQVVRAHSGFHSTIAYNPDYEGTRPLNRAFKDRFPINLIYDYDEKIEEEIIPDKRLRSLASRLREMHRLGEIETPTSTRMLLQFAQVEAAFGIQFAVENLVNGYEEEKRAAIREVANLKFRGGGAATISTKKIGGAGDVQA